MSLRDDLPEIAAPRPPEVMAFQPDERSLERWQAGLRPRAADGEARIQILDVIGDDMFGGGVTARGVAAALRAIGERDVTVDINSPGGDFFEGVAIYNMLRAHPGRVSVNVLGLAASAASVIAMAGDDIRIGRAGFLMVHNAWVIAMGNRNDLAEAVALLAPFDAAMAGVYAARAGVDAAQAAAWMDAETWFGGEAAMEAGLADALLPADAVTEAGPAQSASSREGPGALRRLDTLLAKSGLPRSERRALLKAARGGTQDAAATGMQDAAAIHGSLASLIETLHSEGAKP